MQLSLPVNTTLPAEPVPATSPASADAATGSFECLLPPDNPPARPAEAGEGPDAEMAAAILASFWQPMPPPPAVIASVTSGTKGEAIASGPEAVLPGVPANSAPAVLLAAVTARSFATVAPANGRLMNAVVPDAPPAFGAVKTSAAQLAAPETGAPAAMCPIDPSRAIAADSSPLADGQLAVELPVAGEAPANPLPGLSVSSMAANPLAESTVMTGMTVQSMFRGADGSRVNSPALINQTSRSARSPAGAEAALKAGASVPAASALEAIPRGQSQSTVVPAALPELSLAEKIASPASLAAAISKTDELAEQKEFLSAGGVVVNTAATRVGISVAKVPAVMPALPSTRNKSALVAPAASVPAGLSGLPAVEFSADLPAPLATLRDTMAAVVTAVEALERREAIGQKVVDLQFHVGNEPLALRVELRAGTVHTTFRTESPELRTALAQEWLAVVAPQAGRELRLAEPVFHTGLSAGGNPAGQDPSHQQRGQSAPPAPVFGLMRDLAAPGLLASGPAVAALPRSDSLLHAFV